MTPHEQQPDWALLAEKFDYWLPHLAPVTNKLIEALHPHNGDSILDIACGTGEPALTLATQAHHIMLTATDAEAGMIAVARYKATNASLDNIQFTCMPAETLGFANGAFDAVVSRFGVMLFSDPVKGLDEIYRVLKPGGRFAFAVWGELDSMTTLNWAHQVFQGKIPTQAMPPLALATSLGTLQQIDNTLNTAGYSNYSVTTYQLDYQFGSFDEYWCTLELSGMMQKQLDALEPASDIEDIKQAYAELAKEYVTEQGLIIPHNYHVIHGIKD